jgi:hypothetical protein
MVDKLITLLIAPMNTSVPEELARVLTALEGEPLVVPTHVSADERKRLPYERTTAVEQAKSTALGWLNLWRTKVPKYSDGYLSGNQQSHNKLGVDYQAGLEEDRVSGLFDAWTRLANVLHPEFGFVHPLWKLGTPESNQYSRGVRLKVHEFRDTGIYTVHARTWFGPDVVKIIGPDRLLGLPHAKETEWGGVQLDLVESPASASLDTLYPRQREVRQALDEWGVLGDYSNGLKLKPGRNWVPPLWKVRS